MLWKKAVVPASPMALRNNWMKNVQIQIATKPWDWKIEILYQDAKIWCHQPFVQTPAEWGHEEQGGASSLGCCSPSFYKIDPVITWNQELRRQTSHGWSHACQVVANLSRSCPSLEGDLDYHANYIFTPFIWDLKRERNFFKIKDC